MHNYLTSKPTFTQSFGCIISRLRILVMSTALAIDDVMVRTANATSAAYAGYSVVLKKNSQYLRLYRNLAHLQDAMNELGQVFHRKDVMAELESADDETRVKVGRQLTDLEETTREVLMMAHHIRVSRFLRKLYKSMLDSLESSNRMVRNHALALLNTQSALLLLSD